MGTDSGYVHPEGPLHNSCFWFIVNTHYFSKKIIADELFEAWMKRAAK